MDLTIQSTAFRHGDSIPAEYTGDGADVSPPLNWSHVPAGARELALICDDPDAPTPQPWVHWVIYQVSPDATGLPEGVPPATRVDKPVSALQGRNSWSSGGTTGYRGPAPPPGHGTHHYRFRLYALDAPLGLNPGIDKTVLLTAMQGHILAEGELIGTYQR